MPDPRRIGPQRSRYTGYHQEQRPRLTEQADARELRMVAEARFPYKVRLAREDAEAERKKYSNMSTAGREAESLRRLRQADIATKYNSCSKIMHKCFGHTLAEEPRKLGNGAAGAVYTYYIAGGSTPCCVKLSMKTDDPLKQEIHNMRFASQLLQLHLRNGHSSGSSKVQLRVPEKYQTNTFNMRVRSTQLHEQGREIQIQLMRMEMFTNTIVSKCLSATLPAEYRLQTWDEATSVEFIRSRKSLYPTLFKGNWTKRYSMLQTMLESVWFFAKYGLLHLDMNSTNILVKEHPEDPSKLVPHLIDFGNSALIVIGANWWDVRSINIAWSFPDCSTPPKYLHQLWDLVMRRIQQMM